MCGRFTNRYAWPELAQTYRLSDPERLPNWPARYNIAPTQEVPVIRQSGARRQAALLRWGLVPPWAEDARIGSRMINARAETVDRLPAFRSAFRRRRCLVPADGFYEWKPAADGAKQPYFVTFKEPVAFAGLWERWEKGAEPLETFTIVTCAANAALRDLHDRMPVTLLSGQWDGWLDPAAREEALRALLRPAADDLVEWRAVSRAVNSPRNEGPELLTPIDRNP